MECVVFGRVSEYLLSAKSKKDKIIAIDRLIDAMLASMADVDGDGVGPNISEYQLNDGQMIVRTSYKSANDIMLGIEKLRKIQQDYLNQLNGRVTVLKDARFCRTFRY